ncbi:hypothetical protein M0R04_12360 [Candidatus Dojkabacteria bacterium]|nr:hypothetical protein [Candidatus Dojkabacteria bacterium]
MGGYLTFETLPKSVTRKSDIGPGQIGLSHFDPALFLELQQVKLHTHGGADSRTLTPSATPQMVRAYRPTEREEHGVATWTGAASASGSIILTFGTAFKEAPSVFVTTRDGNANILVGTNTPTATGVTMYWRDADATTHVSLAVTWLAKGR